MTLLFEMNITHCFKTVIFVVATSQAVPAIAAEPAYPTRPIRILVPFAAGGGADTMARIITPKLHNALGQAWVVDNRGGAGGNLAAEIVANAAPDAAIKA